MQIAGDSYSNINYIKILTISYNSLSLSLQHTFCIAQFRNGNENTKYSYSGTFCLALRIDLFTTLCKSINEIVCIKQKQQQQQQSLS